MTRLYGVVIVLLLLTGSLLAQGVPVTASLVAQTTDCSVADSCAILSIGGAATATIQLSGTFSATAQFESSVGPAWKSIVCSPGGGGPVVSSATSTGIWSCPVAGLLNVRVRISGYVSGSVGVDMRGSLGAPPSSGNGSISGTVAVNETQIAGSTVVADPCQVNTPTYTPINTTASVRIVSGTSAKKTIICGLALVNAAAVNIALVEGTGSTCGTNTTGISGGATAATGWNLTANGIVMGNGGYGVASGATAATDTCLLLSAVVQVSGHVKWVQQ